MTSAARPPSLDGAPIQIEPHRAVRVRAEGGGAQAFQACPPLRPQMAEGVVNAR